MVIEKILNLDKNEQILQRIKRHPIGLYSIYAAGILAVVALLFLLYIAASSDSFLLDMSDTGYAITFGTLIMFIALVSYVAVYVYKTNELIITNENIIQILQYSLLSRQVSQLNLAKIQDVSVDQFGLLASFFKYGTIEIETAGEASNFRFKYTPNPTRVAKIVIEAHEDYIRNHPAGHNTYRI